MIVNIVTKEGKRFRYETDANTMTVFVARLNGPSKYIDVSGAGKHFINTDAILSVKEWAAPVDPEA